MANSLHDRLRALALGIRPSVAVACGADARGGVDLLDAAGITGWRVGVRLIGDEAANGVRPNHPVLGDWAPAELEADARRWRHLASFVDPLRQAVTARPPDADLDAEDAARFWQGWRRNLEHARELLPTGLVVSPSAVSALEEVQVALPPDLVAGTLPKDVADLLGRAVDLVDPEVAPPPPLVLPPYRDVLITILAQP